MSHRFDVIRKENAVPMAAASAKTYNKSVCATFLRCNGMEKSLQPISAMSILPFYLPACDTLLKFDIGFEFTCICDVTCALTIGFQTRNRRDFPRNRLPHTPENPF